MRPCVTVLALLGVATACIVFLATGSDWLEWPLPGGLPLGNLISPLAAGAIAGAALVLSPRGTLPYILAIGALVAAILWLPVSVALAGNLELNFTGVRGDIWIWYSIATDGLALLAFASALLRRVIVRLRKSGSSDG